MHILNFLFSLSLSLFVSITIYIFYCFRRDCRIWLWWETLPRRNCARIEITFRIRRVIVKVRWKSVKAFANEVAIECFVGASEGHGNAEEWPSQPLSLSRFIGAERGRTIDKTPPPGVGGGWAPRDDNIPLLIAIIPLCYGAFRDSTQWESCCFARFVAFHVARQERWCCVKIYNKFTCARAVKCARMPSLDSPWLGISFENIRQHVLNISRILLRARVPSWQGNSINIRAICPSVE